VITVGVLALLGLGVLPLLPLCMRPFIHDRRRVVRQLSRVVSVLLFWIGFNVSLMTTWGVFFVPEWWTLLVGVPLLQIPAFWLSYRVVFEDEVRRVP
jgi:hypothetical protein